MPIMIPGELDFALDLLGFEWPNVDEDAVSDLANLVRRLQVDLQGTLDTLDDTIDGDLAEAFTSKTATAYITAWTENRTQNMDQMLDLLPGVAGGVDVLSAAIVALKTKVIVELGITAAQLAAAAATAILTGGLSLAANAAIIAARKKALDVVTELAMELLFAQVAEMIIGPLTNTMSGLVSSMLDAPFTSSGSEVASFDMSYDLMDRIAEAIDACGEDQEEICSVFLAQALSLPMFTA